MVALWFSLVYFTHKKKTKTQPSCLVSSRTQVSWVKVLCLSHPTTTTLLPLQALLALYATSYDLLAVGTGCLWRSIGLLCTLENNTKVTTRGPDRANVTRWKWERVAWKEGLKRGRSGIEVMKKINHVITGKQKSEGEWREKQRTIKGMGRDKSGRVRSSIGRGRTHRLPSSRCTY